MGKTVITLNIAFLSGMWKPSTMKKKQEIGHSKGGKIALNSSKHQNNWYSKQHFFIIKASIYVYISNKNTTYCILETG